MNREQISMLEDAVREIRQLRQANSITSARLEVFDSMMLLFNTKPDYGGQCMSPDIAYQIDKTIENEKNKIANPSHT